MNDDEATETVHTLPFSEEKSFLQNYIHAIYSTSISENK